MKKWNIPLYEIYWDEKDVDAVSRVIQRGMFWTGGNSVPKFEKEIANFIGVEHAVAFNSGTSGLFAAIKALDISGGEEVIVPSFTFVATCNSVVNIGAKPVFAEIENETFGLDPDDVKDRISSKTKAIIPVHYGGGACQINQIREIADDHDIFLIEDAAESLGCTIEDDAVGSFGDASMFSFCGNKVLTTGEGGMVLTSDPEIDHKMRLIRSHGRLDEGNYFSSSKSFDYLMLGHNWRMSDITAELGLSQFRKLEQLIRGRREIAEIYNRLLEGLPLRPPKHLDGVKHIFQMYSVLFESGDDREKVREHLQNAGIMTKVYFDCVHLTTYYRELLGVQKGDLPITESISQRILTLPIYPTMKKTQVELVCNEIKEALA